MVQNRRGVMDKIKTTNILLFVVISLLVVQIFLNLELASNAKEHEKEKTEIGLPEELKTEVQKKAFFNSFKEYYNKKDYKALYEWVDESVRMEYSKERMVQTIEMLHSNVGSIESGVFNHFELMPAGNGTKAFVLFYTIKTTRGIASLKINIMQSGSELYKNMGFTIVSK